MAEALAAFGRLDVLVNNAGGTPPRAALQTSEALLRDGAALQRHQRLPALAPRACRSMVETAGGGAIVNISSRASDMVQTGFVAYGAAKAALNMLTRNLAAELAPKVRVNAISVGGVDTDALASVLKSESAAQQFEANTPMRRPGTVEDIAACALYLASPAAAWVTGKVFQIDGGTEFPAIRVPTPPL